MMPGSLTSEGKSISPNLVEDVIQNGPSTTVTVNGVERTIYQSGTVEVVTEQGGNLVVTVNPYKLDH